jgi:pyruvate/2-oxoacid:ferredoxin oxidoreductase alpha subunit
MRKSGFLMLKALKSAPHPNDTKSEFIMCVYENIKRVLYNVCLAHHITRFYITPIIYNQDPIIYNRDPII